MPAGWAGEAGCVYSLVYWDGAGAGYLLKGVAMDTVLVISLLNLNNPNQTSDTSITPADFVQLQGSSPQISDADTLVSKIGDELVNKVIGKKEAEPAAASKKATETKQESPLMDGRLPRGINPNMPPDYGGVLPRVGGADLDPLHGGGILGGGMVMDPTRPRGGRGMEPRWDPVGPGRGGRGGLGGLSMGGRRNFGDEMAPVMIITTCLCRKLTY